MRNIYILFVNKLENILFYFVTIKTYHTHCNFVFFLSLQIQYLFYSFPPTNFSYTLRLGFYLTRYKNRLTHRNKND